MVMTAATAADLSAKMSAAPTASPTASPTAWPTVAQTVEPTAAPSKMPAAGLPSVGPLGRTAKDEMRVASGNLRSVVQGKETTGAPSAASRPSQPGSSRSGPSVGMVVLPVHFRRATTAEKGNGPPKVVKTATMPVIATLAPPAPRRLAAVSPRLGDTHLATLEFRKSRMPGRTESASTSAVIGAGRGGRAREFLN